jgi:hypothetical protein
LKASWQLTQIFLRRWTISSPCYTSHKQSIQGIVFLDIFPILRDPASFETLITHFVHHLTSHTIPNSPTKKIDVVVGLDARGFLLGPIIALRLGAAFVPVRKKGKLPGQCVTATYEKEYGAVSLVSLSASLYIWRIDFVWQGLFRNASRCYQAWSECHRRR